MDCVAVTLSLHVADQRKKSLIHFVLPVAFAVAHTIQPIIGWGLGTGLRQIISQYDHWISFILLFFLGARMVHSSLTQKKLTDAEVLRYTSPKSLLLLVFATSIDSVLVGMTFAFLDQPVLMASLIIGVTTLFMSLTADIIGDHIGQLFKNSKHGIFGGLVLMGIGTKILIEHLFF